MSIRFEPGNMPSKEKLLEEAAGVGMEFEPNTIEEIYFLDFCRVLYSSGFADGLEALRKNLTKVNHEQRHQAA